jgi:hypothetical protein
MAKGIEKEMNLMYFIVKRSSKKNDVPGTTDGEVEKPCPVCGRRMRKYKPCCGNPEGYIGCVPCGWKE